MTPGTTYLLRVANGGVSAMLNLVIEGHGMTVVELDGRPIVPRVVSSLDLHTGQRAAILIAADQAGGSFRGR